MAADRGFLIFVLGSFRDVERASRRSLALLNHLVAGLRDLGWDAFLSGDARSIELAGGDLTPRAMTEKLEALCDLAVYIATPEGRDGGWAAEIVAMQLKHPEGASKRVLFVRSGFDLSGMLDPEKGGYLAEPAIAVEDWDDEADLLNRINDLAVHVAGYGRLSDRSA